MPEVQNIYLGAENYPLFDEASNGRLGLRMDSEEPIVLNSSVVSPEGVELQDYAYGIYIRNLPVHGLTRSTVAEFDRRNLING